MLKDMFLSGAALLENNRASVDALNVFPVPDGDTGTNMSLTMKSTVKEISSLDVSDGGLSIVKSEGGLISLGNECF